MVLPVVRVGGRGAEEDGEAMKWSDRCPCERGRVHVATVFWLIVVAFLAVFTEPISTVASTLLFSGAASSKVIEPLTLLKLLENLETRWRRLKPTEEWTESIL